MPSKVGQDRTREEVCEYLSKNKWYPLIWGRLWVPENLIDCSTAFRGLLIRSEKLITFHCLPWGWRCCWQMGRAAAALVMPKVIEFGLFVLSFWVSSFSGCFGWFREDSSPSLVRPVCWWSHQVGCWKVLIRYWLRLVLVFFFFLWGWCFVFQTLECHWLFKISPDLSLGFSLLQFPACKAD